jgi:malonate transporter
MDQFLFTLTTIAPVFLICFLGIFLRKVRLIDDDFVRISSQLVFTVALPALIFVELSETDFLQIFQGFQILYVLGATTIAFVLIWSLAKFFISRGKDLGAFVQGSFRSNYAIVGFAIIVNLFGKHALSQASVILVFVMPLYNLLAIIVLTATRHQGKRLNIIKTGLHILGNPLIIATIVSMPFSTFQIPIPKVVSSTASYLSSLALPLALIGIGGSLNTKSIIKASRMAFIATVIKLVLIPGVFTYIAICLGFRGEDLAVMFLLFASPTAVASFVMAKAMGANSKLAGNIVLMTTLGASVTITVGIFILKSLGYI